MVRHAGAGGVSPPPPRPACARPSPLACAHTVRRTPPSQTAHRPADTCRWHVPAGLGTTANHRPNGLQLRRVFHLRLFSVLSRLRRRTASLPPECGPVMRYVFHHRATLRLRRAALKGGPSWDRRPARKPAADLKPKLSGATKWTALWACRSGALTPRESFRARTVRARYSGNGPRAERAAQEIFAATPGLRCQGCPRVRGVDGCPG